MKIHHKQTRMKKRIPTVTGIEQRDETNQNTVSLRQREILKRINAAGYTTIEELAKKFGKTTQTIRADILALASSRMIRRYHGGAASIEHRDQTPYQSRQIMNHAAKTKIAEKAAALIGDGSGVYFGIGTTVETVALKLKSRNDLRIVTNNINIVRTFADCPSFQIYLAGGEIRNTDLAVVGETALEFLGNFRMEYAVIGISGIDDNGDLLDYDFRETNILRSVIRTTKHIILVADFSKFSLHPIARVTNIENITSLITDQQPPKRIRDICARHDVKLIVCS